MNTKQSGNKSDLPKQLFFERTMDASVLSGFSCGIDSMDEFIHQELQNYLWMGSCQMYVIYDGDEVIAMFCLDNHNLCLSEVAKEKIQEGVKPSPTNAPETDSSYWYRTFYDAIEITYLAVIKERQHQHIGSFIIERIMDKVAHDADVCCDFVTVRALKHKDYSAVPFYQKCGFYPAEKEIEGRNLFMYRIVSR